MILLTANRPRRKLLSAITVTMAITSGVAFTAPSVSSVSGDVGSGGQVIISGAGFGTKAVASPLVFDNFEAGTNGAPIAGSAPTTSGISRNWVWREYRSGSNAAHFSDSITRPNSTLSSRHVFSGGSYNVSLEILHEVPNAGDEVYFSFWRYQKRTTDVWSRNVKPWVAYGTNGGTEPLAYNGWGSPPDDGSFRNAVIDAGSTASGTLWGGPNVQAIEGEWVRIEGYLKQSSPTSSDGAFQIWIHRSKQPSISLVQNATNYQTRSSNHYWRQWHFGSYYDTSPANAAGEVYLDEVYFDRTRARVEIGDAPQWSQCTRREVQIPTSWSPGRISISANPGGFSAGQVAYLYVIDAQGVVNAQGYPVTIGRAVEVRVPTPPTGIAIH